MKYGLVRSGKRVGKANEAREPLERNSDDANAPVIFPEGMKNGREGRGGHPDEKLNEPELLFLHFYGQQLNSVSCRVQHTVEQISGCGEQPEALGSRNIHGLSRDG